MNTLLTSMSVLVAYPALALVPFLALLLLYRASRRSLVLAAAAAWAVYAAYEFAMHARWICSGDCNIRIDLLAIYPALLVFSGVAVLSALWSRRPVKS